MAGQKDVAKHSGFLSRLLRDEAGNTIAIMAAAVIPTIGLIGGGVDMSRIYLAKTRLQAACDAGSLMGRKVMGTGTWQANSYKARTEANKMFDANFKSGDYGTAGMQRTFSETGGNVSGKASVDVPMSLMKVLGQDQRKVEVTCQSELRIPNTDVMFVLDVTGSMGDAADGKPITATNPSKMDGLKKATKCFYEALAKDNIDDIAPADCGETSDPENSNASTVQLRFGFVPYSTNVNVGKLLPFDFIADSWTYQSRQANFVTTGGNTPIYGTESAGVQTNVTTQNANYSGWYDVPNNVVIGGKTYFRNFRVGKGSCGSNTAPPRQNGQTVWSNTPTIVSVNPTDPGPGTTVVTKIYEQTQIVANVEYRYVKSGSFCYLQDNWQNSQVKTITTQTTTPITFKTSTSFDSWTYKPVTFNISALKDSLTTPASWRNSVALPLGNNGTNINIAWDGCIEERQTVRVDDDPTGDWNPIPTAAKDMDIDLKPVPGDVSTQWGPALLNAVWLREDSSGDKTLSNQTRTGNGSHGFSRPSYYCPTQAKLYQSWTGKTFKDYVNTLTPNGFTYHDIGLLWGARLMSPTGIFSEITAPDDKDIQRHLIFMTDGDTVVGSTQMHSAYGVHWYDRRQTDATKVPTTSLLEKNLDERTDALCTAIKNKNITLWVVSYGDGVNTATTNRLKACATPGRYYDATDANALNSTFKGIAAQISALRLTD
ncbi:TadE/TadG family type IV pilus assembly protein [Sphingorhabdus arenilitoris]|uniref:TadE/TadG family type IV pilus assembly protein n=1 Tax=Sphingorhabdus arenilitoris TaxID=1490041 RepID=A0ABV8RF64_9SPHN